MGKTALAEFRRLMQCGHGRCFTMLKQQDPAPYLEIVRRGCVQNDAFDMQSEGSRGIYMYELACCFAESGELVQAASERFLELAPDGNTELMQHLCDFLAAAWQDGNLSDEKLFRTKYETVSSALRGRRPGPKRDRTVENYVCLCITLLQNFDSSWFLRIARDIAAYFPDAEEARWELGWLLEIIRQQLNGQLAGSEDISYLKELLEAEGKPRFPAEEPSDAPETANDVYALAFFGRADHKLRRQLAALDDGEKRLLADQGCEERDPEIRARIWWLFANPRCPFPLSPAVLIRDAESEHDMLRESALEALCILYSTQVRSFALQLLHRNPKNADGMIMLIRNYQPEDAELLLGKLQELQIDRAGNSGWHGVISAILDEAEVMPDDALRFIYEHSRCSCCREYALEHIRQRGLLTAQLKLECRHDCNFEIRSTFGA